MKEIRIVLFVISIYLFTIIGCGNYYNDLYLNINSKILSDPTLSFFSFHPEENNNLTEEIEARINNNTSEIIVVSPVGSNITAKELNPRFTSEGLVYVKSKLQTSGLNEHQYNNPDDPVIYEVISANGKNRKKYTVTVLEHNSRIYVNPTASGIKDGSTWINAFNNLQDAIEIAELFPESKEKEIWIAAGTYKPGAGNNTDEYFLLTANTSYIGGFSGNETDKNQRNISANKTIISGDLGNEKYSHNLFGSFGDNTSIAVNKDITFDGIEFVSAKTASTGIRKFGAAINVSLDSEAALKLFNCTFSELEGSAIFALNGNAIFSNTVFTDITINDEFGAVYINGINAEIKGSDFNNITGNALSIDALNTVVENTQFKNIKGSGISSQALYVNSTSKDGSVKIDNVNIDSVSGGRGIYVTSYNNLLITESQIKNCTITGHGGGIYLNNFGKAEVSFTNFIETKAVSGDGIFYIGDENDSSLLLIDIKIDYASVNSVSHPQMNLSGNNITVR